MVEPRPDFMPEAEGCTDESLALRVAFAQASRKSEIPLQLSIIVLRWRVCRGEKWRRLKKQQETQRLEMFQLWDKVNRNGQWDLVETDRAIKAELIPELTRRAAAIVACGQLSNEAS